MEECYGKIINFEKPIDFQTTLFRYGIYAVESLAMPTICYGVSDGQFAIMSRWQGIKVPLNRTMELAEKILDEDVKAEVVAIYEDVKDLRLGAIW